MPVFPGDKTTLAQFTVVERIKQAAGLGFPQPLEHPIPE
jgi:hypothetical protein